MSCADVYNEKMAQELLNNSYGDCATHQSVDHTARMMHANCSRVGTNGTSTQRFNYITGHHDQVYMMQHVVRVAKKAQNIFAYNANVFFLSRYIKHYIITAAPQLKFVIHLF